MLGGDMELHFNLKSVFGISLFLMILQMLGMSVFAFGFGIGGLYLAWLYKNHKLDVCDGIFVLGMLVNLWYVAGLGINIRQYDYFNFFMHAVYFVEHDFFVKNPLGYLSSAYYQPPLWGGIAGVVTKIGMLLGKTREEAFDCVRYISYFAVAGVYIESFRFFKKFNFKKNVLVWGWGCFVLLPIHTILAGLNNNDALVYFLMVAIFAKGYRWYVDGGVKNSLKIAWLLVLAGMVKFSGLMMLAYLGCLGIVKLCKSENKIDCKLWSEFLFIGVGGMIGFAWGFLLLYYGLPLVPPPQDVSFQNMAAFSIMQRLFDFSGISYLFADVRHGVIEKNVWLSLVKTSVFGEWAWNGGAVSYVVYIFGIMMALLGVISFAGVLKYKLGKDYGLNLAIVMFVFAVFISWALFWLEFPYFCSTEFRYVVGIIVPSFLWMMNWWQQKNLPKWANKLMASLIVVFGVCKIIVVLSTI
jgi:hypothetical protein